MEEDSGGLTVWNGILGAALKIPGARIDRAAFLRSALTPHVASDLVLAAIDRTPAKAGVPKELIAKVAMYVSDRDLLETIGAIDHAPGRVVRCRVPPG